MVNIFSLLLVVFAGWFCVFFGMGLVFFFEKRFLKDNIFYIIMQTALGMMLCHFAFTTTLTMQKLGSVGNLKSVLIFIGGFFTGTFILIFYTALKEALFEGPPDEEMMKEFGHKFFYLDPASAKRSRYSIYSLRYDLAICYGLHAAGGGIGLYNAIAQMPFETISYPLIGVVVIQKLTEGLSIAAPSARSNINGRTFFTLGFIASFPFVLGIFLGALGISEYGQIFFTSMAGGTLFYCLIMMAEMVYMSQRADVKSSVPVSIIMASFCFFLLLHLIVHTSSSINRSGEGSAAVGTLAVVPCF